MEIHVLHAFNLLSTSETCSEGELILSFLWLDGIASEIGRPNETTTF